jgi:hypothetical protein
LREVTHPGAHLLARCLHHPPGTRRAFSSSSEETSRVWRGPKTLGFAPSAPTAREPLGVCCWPEPKASSRSRRTPPCPTATRRPDVLQSVSAAPRANSRARARCGPPLPFTVTAISQRAFPFEDAHPNRTGTRAIAFCLVPLAMTTQFSLLCNAGSPERQPPSPAWPPFRTGPSAVCCVDARSKIKPSGLAEGRIDGRGWIISDEHTPGVFRERLRLGVCEGVGRAESAAPLDAGEGPSRLRLEEVEYGVAP